MKTIKSLIAVAASCALILAADSAFAQIGRGNIGAKLRARTQTRLGGQNMEIIDGMDATAIQAEPMPMEAPAVAESQGAAQTQAAQASAQPKEPLKKSDGSEFVLPENATSKELIAKANDLMSTEVAFESEEEYAAWLAKMFETVSKIADTVFKTKDLDDEDFLAAVSLKGQVLCYQASLDSKYLPKLSAYADLLAKNKRVQSLDDGRDAALAFKGVYLQAKIADVAERNGTTEELTSAMNEVSAFITANPQMSDITVDLVYPVAVVAANQGDETIVDKIWNPIRKQLEAASETAAKNALQMLEGTIRYSQLEGKPFEWKGCDVDGKPFDASLVEGHVVVVDFWASWNPSCAQQHAQLRELYKKYKDQGFEIVSYNLDGQLKDMEDYMKKNETPWINLSDRATVDAKETSLAAYYGISEIPTMILIGGDGNTAALDLNMESLVATLNNVFAKSARSAAEADPAAVDAAPAKTNKKSSQGTEKASAKTSGTNAKKTTKKTK